MAENDGIAHHDRARPGSRRTQCTDFVGRSERVHRADTQPSCCERHPDGIGASKDGETFGARPSVGRSEPLDQREKVESVCEWTENER